MGSTCTALMWSPMEPVPDESTGERSAAMWRFFWGHVGDSRLYLYRPGKGLSLLTKDHTVAETLVRSGKLQPEDVPHFPHRHMLVKALGSEQGCQMDPVQQLRGLEGDRLLLCSDGFSNHLKPEELMALMASREPLSDLLRQAVARVKEKGGDDNITVVMIRFDRPHLEEQAQPERRDLVLVPEGQDDVRMGGGGSQTPVTNEHHADEASTGSGGPDWDESSDSWLRRVQYILPEAVWRLFWTSALVVGLYFLLLLFWLYWACPVVNILKGQVAGGVPSGG